MEFHQLRSFVAVARDGRLSKAADRLHTSQPSVSAHIKALEEELGVALFSRTPRGMVLTNEGRQLVERARRILAEAEDMVAHAREISGACVGEFRLGINTDPQFLRIDALFQSLADNHSGIQVRVLKSTSMETPRQIQEGRLDGGFIYGECALPGVTALQVDAVRLLVVAPSSLAERLTGAGWAEVADMPWIWVTEECPYHVAGERAFAAHGVRPRAVLRTDDEEMLLALVRAGKGLALLREDEARAAQQAGEAVIWEQPVAAIPVCYLSPRHSRNERVGAAVLDSVRRIWELPAGA